MPDPIGPNDIVIVQGNYLVKQSDGSRFLMKGIAFPVSTAEDSYNVKGWQDVLYQLHETAPQINTVRMYDMDPTLDYSAFFHAAAALGIYVLVPLTSAAGAGVLDRTQAAPNCYSPALFSYGKACIDNFGRYPNVLAGVIANEVMNSLETWKAAPCVLAYSRDLKLYSRRIPLLYSAQHDSIGAAVSASQAMKVTMDYLTCHGNESSIDIFGINIESWCSSTQEYLFNPDGSIGTYRAVHEELSNATRPIVFSEMGCSLSEFNKDNGLARGARDWSQISIVLGDEMVDSWSGFCAYAYDGNVNFNMMRGGPWNGECVLEPTKDYDNFVQALSQVDTAPILVPENYTLHHFSKSSCENVAAKLLDCCELTLLSVDDIPSHASNHSIPDYTNPKLVKHHDQWPMYMVGVVASLYALLQCIGVQRRKNVALASMLPHQAEISSNGYHAQQQEMKATYQYQAINNSN